MNSQDLILGKIADAFPADGPTLLIRDPGYSNTGTLRTLNAETLERIASVTYDFQGSYCNFGPMSNRVAALWYDTKSGSADWVTHSIPELVARVVAHLNGQGAAG